MGQEAESFHRGEEKGLLEIKNGKHLKHNKTKTL